MTIHHGRSLAPFAAALAMAALLLPMWSVPAARAAGAADTQASAVLQLINGERAHLGRPALSVDPYLASKARDGAIWCPNDASLVVAGRAEDMAVSGYFSHDLRLCPGYTIIDAMKTWGYTRGRGEIISNNSVGLAEVSYAYGCSPSIATCPGPTTTTYNTVARAMSGWMRSSVHYSIITGSYDRVGCGAWVGSGGVYYYSCLFAAGGSPIATPRPIATAEATPEGGVDGAASPTAAAVTQPAPWPTPSGALMWLVVPEPATPAPSGPPVDGPAATGLTGGPPSGLARAASEPQPPTEQVALTVLVVVWLLAVVWLRLGPMRRYRP